VNQIVKVSKMVYDSGIPTATSVLLGLPNETKEDMEETLKLMKRVKADLFDVNSYTPLPGTPLHDAMSEADRENIDWRKVSLKSFDSFFSRSVSQDDFKKCISKAYDISNRVRRKTVLRFAARMFFDYVTGAFKAVEQAISSVFSHRPGNQTGYSPRS
jgi:tRNA A37 methylthiotransferase MiaB